MNLLYTAGVCLVLAQIVGIYGLITRKADLVFALVMAALLITALVTGGIGAYDRIH